MMLSQHFISSRYQYVMSGSSDPFIFDSSSGIPSQFFGPVNLQNDCARWRRRVLLSRLPAQLHSPNLLQSSFQPSLSANIMQGHSEINKMARTMGITLTQNNCQKICQSHRFEADEDAMDTLGLGRLWQLSSILLELGRTKLLHPNDTQPRNPGIPWSQNILEQGPCS